MAVAFARVLRGPGSTCPSGGPSTFAQALALTGVDRSERRLLGGADHAARAGRRTSRPTTGPSTPSGGGGFELTIERSAPGRADDRPRHRGRDAPATRRTSRRRPQGPTLVVRWSRQEVLRHKDFAAYTHAEFEEARPADGRPPPPRRAAPLPRGGARPARPRGGPTCAAPCGGRCAPAASRSGGPSPKPGERPRRIVLICDVSRVDGALLPGPGAVPARRRGRPGPDRGLRPRAPGSPASPGSCRPATPTPPWPGRPGRCQTGREVPGWGRACGPSTTSGACGAWPGGRWWSSSPTGGTGATRPCSPSRCSACSGWPTGRCGSTR